MSWPERPQGAMREYKQEQLKPCARQSKSRAGAPSDTICEQPRCAPLFDWGVFHDRRRWRSQQKQQPYCGCQANHEHELEIIDVGDDRGLPRNLAVECRPARRGGTVPEKVGASGLQHMIEWGEARGNARVH